MSKVPVPTNTVAQLGRLQRSLGNTVGVQRLSDDCGKSLIGERQPRQPCHRLAVAHQGQQYRRRRQTGRIVERAVDRVEHPHQRRVDVGAAEFLAVHLDAGFRHQRVDHLAFDREVDLGGEVVALLRHGGFGTVAGHERLGRLVEDRGGLGDQSVEVGLVERHRRLLSYRGQCLRQCESPGVQGLSDDRSLHPAAGEGGDGA